MCSWSRLSSHQGVGTSTGPAVQWITRLTTEQKIQGVGYTEELMSMWMEGS